MVTQVQARNPQTTTKEQYKTLCRSSKLSETRTPQMKHPITMFAFRISFSCFDGIRFKPISIRKLQCIPLNFRKNQLSHKFIKHERIASTRNHELRQITSDWRKKKKKASEIHRQILADIFTNNWKASQVLATLKKTQLKKRSLQSPDMSFFSIQHISKPRKTKIKQSHVLDFFFPFTCLNNLQRRS